MTTGLLALLLILLIVFITSWSGRRRTATKAPILYHYMKQTSIMTPAERKFFVVLQAAVGDSYYVFPQIRLSTLLDHRVKGKGWQSWKSALRHINQKSVDYVLCDKAQLAPLLVIELDDWSHDKVERQLRDAEVERILAEAQLPLLRFRNPSSLTQEAVTEKIQSFLSY